MDLADQATNPIDRQVERHNGSKCWIVVMGNKERLRGGPAKEMRSWRMYVMAKTPEGAVRTAKFNNYHKTIKFPVYVRPCSYRDLGAQESRKDGHVATTLIQRELSNRNEA